MIAIGADMVKQSIRIATRQSALAMWQTEFVKNRLELAHPGLRVEIVGMTTRGDRIQDRPLVGWVGRACSSKSLRMPCLTKPLILPCIP